MMLVCLFLIFLFVSGVVFSNLLFLEPFQPRLFSLPNFRSWTFDRTYGFG